MNYSKVTFSMFCFAFYLVNSASAAGFGLLSGAGFSAPNVAGVANVGNPQYGDIIFDTSNNSFAGYNGVGSTGWVTLAGSSTVTNDSSLLENLGLNVSASGGTLTIALTQADGTSNPSNVSGQAVNIAFRDSSSVSGGYSIVSITSALSMTLPGSATLGGASGSAYTIYVYAFNNAGTVTLGASLNTYDEGSVQSSSTTSNSNQVIYQSSALSNKAIRLIGKLVATNTSSSWATPTEVSIAPFRTPAPVVAIYNTSTTTIGSAGASTLAFTNKIRDTHNAYNTSTGVFTVPIAGTYLVRGIVEASTNISTGQGFWIQAVQTGSASVSSVLGGSLSTVTSTYTQKPSGSNVFYCAAGDTLYVQAFNGSVNSTAASGSASNNSISITRIGN